MANVKNAKKKIKQIAKTTKANEMLKSTVKNSIKNTGWASRRNKGFCIMSLPADDLECRNPLETSVSSTVKWGE